MFSITLMVLSLLPTQSRNLSDVRPSRASVSDFATGQSVTLAKALTPAGRQSFEAFVCRDLRADYRRKEGLAVAKCPAITRLAVRFPSKNCVGSFSGIDVDYHYNAYEAKQNSSLDYIVTTSISVVHLRKWVYPRFRANSLSPLCPPPFLLPSIPSKK
jgi:hypothetical protein